MLRTLVNLGDRYASGTSHMCFPRPQLSTGAVSEAWVVSELDHLLSNVTAVRMHDKSCRPGR
jgi:hypothetical protein